MTDRYSLLVARPTALFVTLAGLLWVALPVPAFPPAPDHVFYGQVRDEFGNPIVNAEAEVVFTTSAGVETKTVIRPNLAPGVNYRLRIPMDAGLSADPYKPTAVKPTVPFRLSVKVGGGVYLPIEMKGDFRSLGEPAAETRIDLTLGEDTDGDGLPDVWERSIITSLGGGLTLDDIRPGDDSDRDGLSNLNEYLAGTYAFDAADGFSLEIAGLENGNPLLEFTAIRGRTYSVVGSANLRQWVPVAFVVPADGAEAAEQANYQSNDTRLLRVKALPAAGDSLKYFKLLVR